MFLSRMRRCWRSVRRTTWCGSNRRSSDTKPSRCTLRRNWTSKLPCLQFMTARSQSLYRFLILKIHLHFKTGHSFSFSHSLSCLLRFLSNRANEEIAQVRSKANAEGVALNASLRKEQMKVESLERAVLQKVGWLQTWWKLNHCRRRDKWRKER